MKYDLNQPKEYFRNTFGWSEMFGDLDEQCKSIRVKYDSENMKVFEELIEIMGMIRSNSKGVSD